MDAISAKNRISGATAAVEAQTEHFPNPFDDPLPVNGMLQLTDEQFEAWLKRGEELSLPVPWCHGNPRKIDCIQAGYCRKDPACDD